jgi:hypothetical protein
MFAPGLPSITTGLRGLAYMEVRVQGPSVRPALRQYGGAVVNPANALARIIAALHDEDGRVTIPGFYDRVQELTVAERGCDRRPAVPGGGAARGGRRPRAGRRGRLRAAGAHLGAPDAGRQRPPLRLHGRGCQDGAPRARHGQGLHAPGARTRITARWSGCSPSTCSRWRPRGSPFRWRRCTAARRGTQRGRGRSSTPRPARWRRRSAASRSTSARAAPSPSCSLPGGARRAGVLIGFGLPGENAHAPNEWMSVENFHTGAEAIALLYEELR